VAQHADTGTKPIGLTFALAGLYLHVECGFTGRHVQRAHMVMGERKRTWPAFVLLKGVLVPLLIVQLYRYRRETPVLATAGMGLVTIALTVALGQWLGWLAGVMVMSHRGPF